MDKASKHFAIRDLRSATPVPTRFCDIVKIGKVLYVEFKVDKRVVRMPLKDFLYQVNLARESLLDA